MSFALRDILQSLLVSVLPVLFAITLHEAAHGWMALRVGDDTAKKMGRLTLNPLAHLDPFGTVALPALLWLLSGGVMLLGYAKPVPVDLRAVAWPRRAMALVALAGPLSNLAQALIWALTGLLLSSAQVQEPFFFGMVRIGIGINLALFAFNLFPLPPLDGGRVLLSLARGRFALWLLRVESLGILLAFALAASGLMRFWLLPLMQLGEALISAALLPVQMLLPALDFAGLEAM